MFINYSSGFSDEDFESDGAASTFKWNFLKVVFRKRWQLILEFIYIKKGTVVC